MTRHLTGPKPPPVSERPPCAYCGRHMRPSTGYVMLDGFTSVSRTLDSWPRYWDGSYEGPGEFCRQLCATRFARSAYRAGYRVRGSK